MSYYVREPRGVAGVDTAALQAAGLAARAGRDAGPLGGRGRRVAGPPARRSRTPCSRAWRSRRRWAPTGCSAEVLEHAAAFEPLPSHRIAGGNQRLAEAMAAQLGDRVRLRSPVAASRDEADPRRRRRADADHAIIAVPLPSAALRELALPAGSTRRSTASRWATRRSSTSRSAPAAPTSAVMSVPDRYWCWTAAGAERVLNCFAGSPAALERLARLAGARRREPARALRPSLDARRRRRADHVAGRRVQHRRPTGRRAARRAGRPLHFAGEHTAGPWGGLMEGALRSGLRAAREIV